MSGVLNLLLAGAASAIKDAYFNLTTLLLNTSSTNGAQNNTFLDSSTNNFTITRNGNTTQGTFTPFSQTGWSNYFNGDVNCDLQTPSNAAFGYGTGDFCLEAYVYQQTDANARIIDHTAGAFNFGLLSTGIVTLFDGSTTHNTPSSSVSLNTWTHICATRQGSTLRLFVNGVLKYNTTFTVSKADSAVNIGSNPGGGGETLNGYISNLRIVKGGVPSAYSTSSTTNGTTVFTPSTTPLSASASLTAGSLSLLTCQSNRFVDNSANAFAISVTAGTPSVQAFSPFLPTAAYDAAVVGGSGYFDGSGDYLNTASDAAFNLNGVSWTIECFVYLGDYTGDARLWTVVDSSTNMYGAYLRSGTLYIGKLGFSEVSIGSLAKYQWHHVAFVNVSGTITCYINGVSSGTTGSYTFPNANCSFYVAGSPANYALATTQGYISSLRVLKGTAQYTSTFTPPTAPLTAITNTSLLLSATNAGIYDSAAKNVLETVGNAQVSTTQAKWGTTAIYLDGTGDYAKFQTTSAANYNFTFGSSDFTIEMWVYPSNTSTVCMLVGQSDNATIGGGSFLIRINGNVDFYSGGTAYTCTGASPSANQWSHIAYVRNGTSLKTYLNGTQAGSTTLPSSTTAMNVGSTNYPPILGAYSDGSGAFTGYIDDVRISKFARYTANFSVPTEAFPVQ